MHGDGTAMLDNKRDFDLEMRITVMDLGRQGGGRHIVEIVCAKFNSVQLC